MINKQAIPWTLRKFKLVPDYRHLLSSSHHFTLLLLEDKLHLAPLRPDLQVSHDWPQYITNMWFADSPDRKCSTLEQELVRITSSSTCAVKLTTDRHLGYVSYVHED